MSSNDDNKEGVVETKVMMGTRMLMIRKMIKIELVLVLRRALDVLALQRRRSCINDKMLMPQIWTLFMFFSEVFASLLLGSMYIWSLLNQLNWS